MKKSHTIRLAKLVAWTTLLSQGKDFQTARNEIKNFYNGTKGIFLPEHQIFFNFKENIADILKKNTILNDYKSNYISWLGKSKHNSITGLEKFDCDFSAGVTQALENFILYYKDKVKNFCFYHGEYFLGPLICNYNKLKWKWIEDHSELNEGDALVISFPFCDTGNAHNKTNSSLERCEESNIPVFLDCAYWNLAKGISIDCNFHCIKVVSFSLSKAFPVPHMRIGIRFSEKDYFDSQKLHDKIAYNNRLSAYVGLQIFQTYHPDWFVDTFNNLYDKIINKFKLKSSQSICFADGDEEWKEYNRKNLADVYGLKINVNQFKNRIYLGKLYENKELTNKLLDTL
tara:strand:+ start:309 stop:1337 length:1029 start_codon:yes stop_codon:yes gene_type:complete